MGTKAGNSSGTLSNHKNPRDSKLKGLPRIPREPKETLGKPPKRATFWGVRMEVTLSLEVNRMLSKKNK